jgi:polyisoprenoid-binding protein YceI
MKTRSIYFYGLILVFLGACAGPSGEKAESTEAKEAAVVEGEKMEFMVDTIKSMVEWTGAKPTGEHNGTVSLKKGKLQVQNGNLVAGKFTMDMTSIVNYDLEDPEWNKKLVDHLNSTDFFNTAEYPESVFEITGVKVYDGETLDDEVAPTHWITGNLTIKGITKSITFPADVQLSDTKITAKTSQFTIDRTEWDIKYQSKKFFDDLKDKFINDEIALRITVETQMKR